MAGEHITLSRQEVNQLGLVQPERQQAMVLVREYYANPGPTLACEQPVTFFSQRQQGYFCYRWISRELARFDHLRLCRAYKGW